MVMAAAEMPVDGESLSGPLCLSLDSNVHVPLLLDPTKAIPLGGEFYK